MVIAAGFAKNPRREYWVGLPTVEAIIGQRIAPGLLDRYLGKIGYKGQQIQGEPKDPEASNNLYDYVPGTHGARGKFADRSTRTSVEVFVVLHRAKVTAAVALVAAAIGGGLLLARRNSA